MIKQPFFITSSTEWWPFLELSIKTSMTVPRVILNFSWGKAFQIWLPSVPGGKLQQMSPTVGPQELTRICNTVCGGSLRDPYLLIQPFFMTLIPWEIMQQMPPTMVFQQQTRSHHMLSVQMRIHYSVRNVTQPTSAAVTVQRMLCVSYPFWTSGFHYIFP